MRKTDQQRFDEKWTTIPETSCWWWTASVDGSGYGHMWFREKLVTASRISYTLNCGEIPEELHVLHACDNRICVNPDHLFLGTHKDNMQDRNNKGRARGGNSEGARNGMSKLTEKIIIQIRNDNRPAQKIADFYGVSVGHIYAIKSRKRWNHI